MKEVDYILYAGPDRTGALGFSSAPSTPPFSETPPWNKGKEACGEELLLEDLAVAADRIASDEDLPEAWRQFFVSGSSLGGARPKASCRINGIAHLAKFQHPRDPWHACRAEAACMALAADCGIATARAFCLSMLNGSRDILLVRRFDRKLCGGVEWRIPFASEMTLCDLPEQAPNGSYQDMAQATSMPFYDASYAEKDRIEIFRRMCFNALVGNCDDHVRNHGFLLGPGGWRLSPAYDVAPFLPPAGLVSSQRMGRLGKAMTRENILSATEVFGLNREEAGAIFSRMAAHVASSWEDAFLRHGMAQSELTLLAQCFSLAMQEGGSAPALQASLQPLPASAPATGKEGMD